MIRFIEQLLHPLKGQGYQFWSGLGSDIGEIAIVGAIISVYRKHNCHVKGCWRFGKHPVDGTPFIVCRKHHPEEHPKHYLPTPKDILEAAGDDKDKT